MGRELLTITITLVYSAKARHVAETVLQLDEGSTLAQALLAAERLTPLPGMAASAATDVGIWGKKMPLDHVLRDGDRVEIYRPLTVDPKVARRERFVGQGAKKAAGLFSKRRTGAKAGY